MPNTSQANNDGDALGDACDSIRRHPPDRRQPGPLDRRGSSHCPAEGQRIGVVVHPHQLCRHAGDPGINLGPVRPEPPGADIHRKARAPQATWLVVAASGQATAHSSPIAQSIPWTSPEDLCDQTAAVEAGHHGAQLAGRATSIGREDDEDVRAILEAVDEPEFLLSATAIAAVLLWGVVYLRRQGPTDDTGAVGRAAEAQPVFANDRPPARGDDAAALARTQVPDVTFADVAGLDEAVEELREIKDYLLDPQRFSRLGATLPRGILLAGPPGTGKTLLTKALAGEAGVPFQVVSASSLVEVYVGTGPARIRRVFAEARKKAPSIVLLDELDAIGRTRAAHAIGGTEERESTLNQLLVEMDGFDSADGVLVVGATNRPDVLDPALLRPGRFDRRLVVAPPDLQGRRAILSVHARGKPLGPDADLDAIASRTAGFTGADLANVMNEAALLTGRLRKTGLGSAELEEAIDRLMTGPQRPSRVISAWDKRVIAYHEAGHVLVGWCANAGQDLHRVSVVARGSAHGYTLSVPIEDRVLLSRSELEGQLAVMLGGRVAEEIVFSDPTTGAEDDLERSSSLARKMVSNYGMSDAVGPVRMSPTSDRWSSGVETADRSADVGSEVRRLLGMAHSVATAIVSEHRDALDLLATQLIRSETLDRTDIERLLAAVPRCAGSGPMRNGTAVDSSTERSPRKSRQRTSFPVTDRVNDRLGVEAAS